VEVVAQKQTPTSVRTWPEHILLLVITFVLCWLFFRYRYRKS
jgi:apolipoprotein N-acyltransferase